MNPQSWWPAGSAFRSKKFMWRGSGTNAYAGSSRRRGETNEPTITQDE